MSAPGDKTETGTKAIQIFNGLLVVNTNTQEMKQKSEGNSVDLSLKYKGMDVYNL